MEQFPKRGRSQWIPPSRRVTIRRLRRHRLAVVLVAAALALAISVSAAQTASNRTLACSNPTALVPPVDTSSWQALGQGEYFCDEYSDYTVRLYNNSGGILAGITSANPGGGYVYVSTYWVGCRGAVVKSFLYRNWLGSGASHTSGTNSACAY
jgi:hypothetical protein